MKKAIVLLVLDDRDHRKRRALAVRMGNINTVATPYTQKDTIRVVMLPGGNGEVIGFAKDAEGKFGSLNFGGVTFSRVVK